MKKVLFALFLSVAFAGVSLVSFAQTAATAPKHQFKDVAKGTVISIDATKKEIVVKNTKTQKEKTVKVTDEQLKQVKVGSSVKVTLEAGKNVAESITVAPAAVAVPAAPAMPAAPAAPAASK
jgi:aconitase B